MSVIQACNRGNLEAIKRMLELDFITIDHLNYGFYFACINGYRELIDFLIEKGVNYWNQGLHGACEGGHRELIDFLIEKGADVNDGLAGACEGGHRELVELMIEKGADNWSWGLFHACMDERQDMIELMIEKGGRLINEAKDWWPFDTMRDLDLKVYLLSIHPRFRPAKRFLIKYIRKKRTLEWRCAFLCKELFNDHLDTLNTYPPFCNGKYQTRTKAIT